MKSFEVEKRLNFLVPFALIAVTLIVTPFSTVDPINVPKLWLLTLFAFGTGALLLSKISSVKNELAKISIIAPSCLVAVMTIVLLATHAPKVQQFFGVNGRNTGLLTYFSFLLIFLSTAILSNSNIKKRILVAVALAFGLNAIYGLIQSLGLDPQNWINKYDPVIGTFGNPNFVSAFLGMGMAFAFTYVFDGNLHLINKIFAYIYIAVALLVILKSDAQQGLIVSAISFLLVSYVVLRNKFKKELLSRIVLFCGFVGSILGVFGTLQKGPFSGILYKPSVTYRGDYWNAGIQMIREHPFLGVGLDSYGDWYRQSRSLEATLRRGPAMISNAAHNVFIDIGATAGLIALIVYLLFIASVLTTSIKYLLANREFDPFFTSVFVAWLGYLAQSVISINNIALGIWGWVLAGLLLAVNRWNGQQSGYPDSKKSDKIREVSKLDFTGMYLVSGLLIGAIIGFLPYQADANFRSAISSGDANKTFASLTKFPPTTDRFNLGGQLFSENNISSLMHQTALKAVDFNRRSFDSWNMLYVSTESSDSEKKLALKKMLELDPNNPDLKKLD